MGSWSHMCMFTHVTPCSSMMIQDPNVLCYHLCNLSRWDTHGNRQGQYAPWQHQMELRYIWQGTDTMDSGTSMRSRDIMEQSWQERKLRDNSGTTSQHHFIYRWHSWPKKSNVNSQPIIVKLPTARANLKALPQSIEITLKRIHSILAEFGYYQEAGGWKPYHWAGALKNFARPADTSMWNLCIIKNENAYYSTKDNGDFEI